jgi:hypothetical protein
MAFEYGENVEALVQQTVDAGMARLKLCNRPHEKAIQNLIDEINKAFQDAAHSSHKSGSGPISM